MNNTRVGRTSARPVTAERWAIGQRTEDRAFEHETIAQEWIDVGIPQPHDFAHKHGSALYPQHGLALHDPRVWTSYFAFPACSRAASHILHKQRLDLFQR